MKIAKGLAIAGQAKGLKTASVKQNRAQTKPTNDSAFPSKASDPIDQNVLLSTSNTNKIVMPTKTIGDIFNLLRTKSNKSADRFCIVIFEIPRDKLSYQTMPILHKPYEDGHATILN